MSITVKSQYKTVVKMFSSLSGSRSIWQVFQDCIEIMALSIQNSCEAIQSRMLKNESRYIDIIKNYSKEEQETIIHIFAELTNMLEENPYQDLLGDLYMQLDMGSSALGQFFTPYHLSRTMAECAFDVRNVKQKISEKGFITLHEPCIGGGANIIGALDVLGSMAVNWQSDVVVVGQDLSSVTAKMAYVVLSLIGCQAVIKIADTLREPYTEFWHEIRRNSNIWYTPMFMLNAGYMKLRC